MSESRLSITRSVAGFFAAMSLAFALLSGLGLYRLYEIDDEFDRSRQAAAQEELAHALAELEARLQQQGSIIANWDETRQQLISPNYYGYWKSSRLRQASMLSPLFSNVELYDSTGQILPGGDDSSDARIVRTDAGQALYHPAAGLARLTHTLPVIADAKQNFPLGYVQLSFNLVQALKRVHNFTYLRPDTLIVKQGLPAAIRLQELPAHLGYEITTMHEIEMLEGAVGRTYAMLVLAVLVFAAAAYFFVRRLLVRPLVDLSKAIGNLNADDSRMGYVEHLEFPYMLEELDTVRQAIQNYRHKLSEARLALENSNVTFQQQALHDALTGLYNRRAFEEDWEKLVKALDGRREAMALLLFDCDHFKPINDTYGHQVGDLVLQTIAGAVNEVMRSGDRVYRIGGDEFATLLWGVDERMAEQIAERCLESVRNEDFRHLGVLEPISISIGIALDEVSEDADLTRLQAHADSAMYMAKRPGNKKIAIYRKGDASSEDVLVASRETNALYQALAEPERLEIHFQRMLPLGGGCEYLEALTRIRHNDTLLTPDRFLPVVQSRRLEAEFDLAVIRAIHANIETGAIPPGVGVSINLSAQSLHRPEVIAQLIEMTKHAERHPLVLEITETSLVPHLTEIGHFLGILRSNGFRIAMDDFGSGYSPLRYLSDLPVDIIKFDISLIHQLKNNDRAGMVVADFVRMMRDAGYALVAEGVEDEPLLQRVRDLGFSHAQGFHIDVPHALSTAESKVVRLFN